MSRREEEFTRIIQENHSGLRYFIQSLGVNAAWVDDVAQDAFLIAYRKWDGASSIENPGAWLRAIARNLVLNETAKLNRRQRLLDENLSALLADSDPGDSGERYACAAENHEALLGCIKRLSERARSALECRYMQDLNSGQIGSALAMKPAAVRKMLFHARQTLAECLRKTLAESR